MKEKHITDRLSDYIDGTISDSEKELIKEHLTDCKSCKKEYEAILGIVNDLHTLPESISPPEEIFAEVQSRLREVQSAALDVPGRTNHEGKKKRNRGKKFNIFSLTPAWYFRAAAAVIALIGVVFIWLMVKHSTPEVQVESLITEETQPAIAFQEKVKPDVQSKRDVQNSKTGKEIHSERKEAQLKSESVALGYDAAPSLSEKEIGEMRRAPLVEMRRAPLNEQMLSASQIQMFHTEEYDRIYDNELQDALTNPLSTFSIDVDNASYSNVRRFIMNGQMPPEDAVRTEELINYFTYDYPQPSDKYPFSITTELSVCPWNNDHKLLLIGLQGKEIDLKNLPPSNLVFLLDVSGSMNQPNKLPLVKSAFRLLVDQLRKDDRVAIVVYAGRAGLVLEPTPGNEKQRILGAIDELEADGSTAGGEGILLAYKTAEENFLRNGNNRVILATDGDFNIGVSSDAELVRLIEEKRNRGIFLSVLGFGTGNYKDSKMEKLADKGNGNYAYIDNLQEARKVFVGQISGTLFTIAKDVKLQIEFNPAKVKAYRLIGYENRLLAKEDFNNDKKDAGELGAGHSVTALYELVTADGSIDLPEVDTLKYQTQKSRSDAEYKDEILTVKFRYKPPKDTTSKLLVHVVRDIYPEELTLNLGWAAAVAEFGMLLRNSEFKGSSSWDTVLRLARNSRGNDSEGYRAEFIRLTELCRDLSSSFKK